ncbi:hypothetical protein JOB18_040867 [Solea senegalensis]|uniref:Uncharacterized protein n=1 Tax=Solea senegalensis TaxID=28829 RepID=A0AAV6QEN4_SOLSE|nr:hypothetical protein JOB18_040867 [Solea senegalensis]
MEMMVMMKVYLLLWTLLGAVIALPTSGGNIEMDDEDLSLDGSGDLGSSSLSFSVNTTSASSALNGAPYLVYVPLVLYMSAH